MMIHCLISDLMIFVCTIYIIYTLRQQHLHMEIGYLGGLCVYTPTRAYACPLCLQLTVTEKKSQMTRGVGPAEDPDLRVTFSS